MVVDIFKIDKKYDVIYADPPWKYRQQGSKDKVRGMAKQHYSTMSTDDICDLPVRNIARIPVYKCCPVVGKYKYRISLDMLDFTPLVLFNNYWRQEWMDAVAWQNFLNITDINVKKLNTGLRS